MVRRQRVNSQQQPRWSRRYTNRCGGEIRSISHSSRRSLASFANAHRVMRIISNLRNPEHSDARSAMNSPCHCAVNIIGTCTDVATKSRGGQTFRSHRSKRLASFGKQPCLIPTCRSLARIRLSHTIKRCGADVYPEAKAKNDQNRRGRSC